MPLRNILTKPLTPIKSLKLPSYIALNRIHLYGGIFQAVCLLVGTTQKPIQLLNIISLFLMGWNFYKFGKGLSDIKHRRAKLISSGKVDIYFIDAPKKTAEVIGKAINQRDRATEAINN